jgi:hypothetical protein
MRQPIKVIDFHSSVRSWSFEQFQERYKDQLSEDEIKHFASLLGLVNKKPELPDTSGTPATNTEGGKLSKNKKQPDVPNVGDGQEN